MFLQNSGLAGVVAMSDKPDVVERLAAGITREILNEGRIVVFTLSDLENKTVDVWLDACLRLMDQCVENGHPLMVLQDLSNPAARQTAYSKVRGGEVTNAHPNLKGFVAFVLPDTLGAQRTRRFVEAQPGESRIRAIFSTREDALEWLREQL